MDEELKNRFFQKQLDELLNDCTKPYPTVIIESERTEILELIRKFCMFSPKMIPFRLENQRSFTRERLEISKIINYGELYYLVNLN
jgi:hypothetical protein